jgi:multiple antibiotic resistance protein
VLLGKEILKFFNVGLDDFRIAGGLLALIIAFDLFQAQYGKLIPRSDEASRSKVDVHGLAITPFAFPLLVGPAEMGIMITLSNDNPAWLAKAFLTAAALPGYFPDRTDVMDGCGGPAGVGRTGISVVIRVMALIVAAIGVNSIMTGTQSELRGPTAYHGMTGPQRCPAATCSGLRRVLAGSAASAVERIR